MIALVSKSLSSIDLSSLITDITKENLMQQFQLLLYTYSSITLLTLNMFYKESSDLVTSWRFSDFYSRSLKLFFRFSNFIVVLWDLSLIFQEILYYMGLFLGKFKYNLTFFTKRSLIEGLLPCFSVKLGLIYY